MLNYPAFRSHPVMGLLTAGLAFALAPATAGAAAADDARIVAASPVILAASTSSLPHRQILLNLDDLVPGGFDRFDRVIEIVGLDDEDRQRARVRWKHYAEQGYTITRHDLNSKPSH